MASGLPTLADDSGLEVDALGGAPGVRSRRYAGEQASDEANNARLLDALRGLPPSKRGARYVCVLALALPERAGPRGGVGLIAARGTCRGRIADEATRERRLRLRPHLRTRVRAAGRADAGAVDAGREARHLASGQGRPPARAALEGARLLIARRLCVFCGASPGRDPGYLELARSVGAGLAGRGIGIVYGGSRVGLMGGLADAALAAGGEIIGVIPRQLVDREQARPGLSELRIVGSLHERKALMAELADGFIALPGGLGTLEELAEVASWAQLGLHDKPIGLLGGGYWDPLMAWLDRAVAEGFLASDNRRLLQVDADLDSLLARFERWANETPAP